ncbi:hypothetical protein B5F98_05720 [Pseudoflavonifractor sp. An44]|nr:hypothetical protein B5F98_05720 [Pseudoflavonifractor sp. An44]
MGKEGEENVKVSILISTGGGDASNYLEAVERAGGQGSAVYLPQPDLRYDGLILAGGGDMHPACFHSLNRGSRDMDLPRDRRELALLDAFTAARRPVLGICRGHQVVNVWAGGNLVQNLDKTLAPFHQQPQGDCLHPVRTRKGSCMDAWYGAVGTVNSNHHQGLGKLGRGLVATAWSEGEVVEAMEHRTLPLWTVQFHPERMGEAGAVIFFQFVQLCRRLRGDGEV